jgi:hypothetical protein
MRNITIFTLLLFISSLGFSQNFEPAQSELQYKIEKSLKNFGAIERVFITDTINKTFEARPGQEYWAGFAYNTNDKSTRRMMLVELGAKGEKVSIQYPKYTKPITDGEIQVFGINITSPNNDGKTVIYRIDASPQSTVYLYKITRSAS